ncbi:MAG: nucleotidyl transferase AbiEii/AbiGii toxin family protein, partial [Planctomycetes bacterium]|nr:nucleotidyl transferase AbiEii/AbiGii toxin family protein [Planctomycetota bacterium]
MKEHLKKILKQANNNPEGRCLLREYLQARSLEFLQNKGAFSMWSFVGGTSLRFLYDLSRFSEDLDFSATKEVSEQDFINMLNAVKSGFEKELYSITIKAKPNRTVQSALIKFPGLMYEVELSAHSSETISIKLEVDTNPPKGWQCENSIVRRHTMLNIQHYTKPSLLAGKVNALLSRTYTKGRDYYDLMWYLTDHKELQPNFIQLNNALEQTSWQGPILNAENWKEIVAQRIEST